MTHKIFQDKTFPRHVADLMNIMHLMVFKGTDGEEKWDTYLNLTQKEYIALSLAKYYQCDHCIEYHGKALEKLSTVSLSTLEQNVNAMVLFLRIDTRSIGEAEKKHWINAWNRFAQRMAEVNNDDLLPYLVGLAIGIARNDVFLIKFSGQEVYKHLKERDIDPRAGIGEIESLVIFMKAAVSKNRVVDKVEELFSQEG